MLYRLALWPYTELQAVNDPLRNGNQFVGVRVPYLKIPHGVNLADERLQLIDDSCFIPAIHLP